MTKDQRPGHNVEVVRHKGSWVLDRQVARAPLEFFGSPRMFRDADGVTFTIPMGGKVEIGAERALLEVVRL